MTPDLNRFASLRAVLIVLALILSGCSSDGDEKENDASAAELYSKARGAMRNGGYERAILNYRILQSRYPFGRYTEQAQLEMGYCYYKNYEPELAISTMDRFIRTYPTHPHVDYAFYIKGLANFSRGRGILSRILPGDQTDRDQEYSRLAFQEFAELLRRFPDSKYAEDSRQRMVYLRANMARYELTVADYYLRRKAYVAAANRAKNVVENYQETPSVGNALAILIQAYEGMELAQLSQDTLRVLQLNYPNHPYLTGLDEKESWLSRLWPFD